MAYQGSRNQGCYDWGPWHFQILAHQLTLPQPGGQIMPTPLLPVPPEFQTLLRPRLHFLQTISFCCKCPNHISLFFLNCHMFFGRNLKNLDIGKLRLLFCHCAKIVYLLYWIFTFCLTSCLGPKK